MIRNLILMMLASALLSLVLATVCHWAFPDVVSSAAERGEAMSWDRQIAFLMTATAWIAAEVSGLFAIVLAALLWKRRSPKAT